MFISPGVIKYPAQLESFLQIEDPNMIPLLAIGGFTLPEWNGNARYEGDQDFIYYSDRKMAGNCRGLPNPGSEGILALADPLRRLNERGVKTIIQVTNLPHENPLDVIPELVDIAASVEPTAVEVNLSCPNGKAADGSFHAPLCNNDNASGEVMQAARDRVGPDVVLGAKDSPHVTSLEDYVYEGQVAFLAMRLAKIVDFVTGINTIGNQDFPELECGGGRGGMSGPAVAPIARQHISLWNKYAPNTPYLSTGGVDSANASIEIPERLAMPNVIRVGGAQEFYRATQLHQLAARWAIEAA